MGISSKMAAVLKDGRHFYILIQACYMKTSYNELKLRLLHEIQVFRKAPNVTFLFVNNLYVIYYGIQDGCQRRKILLGLFSYINIYWRFL